MSLILNDIESKALIIARRHGFNDAIVEHHHMLMDVYASTPSYFKTLFKSNRFILGIVLLSIYSTQEHATIDQVKEYCEKLNIFSKNSINSFILFLRVSGRIQTVKDENDKRKLLFTPTEKALIETKRLIRTMVSPIQKMNEKIIVEEIIDKDDFVFLFFKHYSEVVFNDVFLHILVPESKCFIMRDAGHVIITHIMTNCLKLDKNRLQLNLFDSAKQCGVSRSHLRRSLVDAEGQGLLDFKSISGEVIINQEFHDIANRYMSLYFSAIEYSIEKMIT